MQRTKDSTLPHANAALRLATFLCLLFGGCWSSTALSQVQSGLATLIEPQRDAFARELLAQRRALMPQAEIEISWHSLPSMPRTCDLPTLSTNSKRPLGRIPVRVQCAGTAPWSFYTYATLSAEQSVVVAAKAILRGQIIGAEDVREEKVSLQPGQSVLTDLSVAIGRIAKRTVQPGRALQLHLLQQPNMVNRGEKVLIKAASGAARITTQGIALENGHLGQQIPVQNAHSKKVIHSWVAAKGVVTTKP